MNKKLLAVLALSATLIVGCSNVAKTDRIQEGAVDGLGNITESRSVRNGVIGSDNTFAHSQTYVQYGKTDNGAYAIRFATAVKGDIDSLSYTRAAIAGKEAATFQVTTVYRGIEAGEAVYYYDGTDLTTDESHAGNYYWACYTIAFETKAHFATNIDVTFNANDAAVSQKQSSLAEICDDCEVVGHNWVREGKLHATSVTKGSINKVCGACGHQEITEVDYNADNSGVLTASEIDAEVSNLDLVRGLKGDFTLKFKWTAQMTQESNWSSARVCLLNLDEGKWAPGKNDNTYVYGKALACPENANTFNGCHYVGYSKNAAGAWYSKDPFTAYAKDMDAEAKVVRSGDFVHIEISSISNVDRSLSNFNEWHFYIPSEKTMNVVLGVTFANLTLLESSLVLDKPAVAKTTREEVTEPVTVEAYGKGYTYEHVVHQTALEGEVARATYKFTVQRPDHGDNTWGHWRATSWRTDLKHSDGTQKTPHPWGEIDPNTGEQYQYNGSLLARLTPLDQDTHDWNGNLAFVKNKYSWFASPETGTGGFNYAELMKDADVTLTINKFGSYVMMYAYIETNLEYDTAKGVDCKGAYSTTLMSFRVPEETRNRIAFSVDTESTNLTVTSCVVENF